MKGRERERERGRERGRGKEPWPVKDAVFRGCGFWGFGWFTAVGLSQVNAERAKPENTDYTILGPIFNPIQSRNSFVDTE